MSSYLIIEANDVTVGTFSRSSYLYQYIAAPFVDDNDDSAVFTTPECFIEARNELIEQKAMIMRSIQRLQNDLNYIRDPDLVMEQLTEMHDYEDEVEQIDRSIMILEYLIDIFDENPNALWRKFKD